MIEDRMGATICSRYIIGLDGEEMEAKSFTEATLRPSERLQLLACTIHMCVNYRVLKGAACDYAKSRVASGGLTLPP
jgi:hypothetical protein